MVYKNLKMALVRFSWLDGDSAFFELVTGHQDAGDMFYKLDKKFFPDLIKGDIFESRREGQVWKITKKITRR